MQNNNYLNRTLGNIVTEDFRTAEVFKNAGIDFCCGGKKTLAEACKEKNITAETILSGLLELDNAPLVPGQNFKEWPLDFLCDYIQNTHHKYVLKSLPDLVFYTKKIAQVHGANHFELNEVAGLIEKVDSELRQHLKNEEEVLFPAIKNVLKSNDLKAKEIITSEITRMFDEHEFAGGAMDSINVITGHYDVPDDGCNTYHVAFKLLEEFEDDLHVHVHLENNILFPKALEL